MWSSRHVTLRLSGASGMGNIMKATERNSASDTDSDQSPFSDHFHGVLHRVTDAEMKALDVIEGSYDRLEVDVELYDGRRQKATVYKMDESKLDRSKPAGLPSERYLDIISQGLKHFAVDQAYIEWIKSQKCIPRKKPDEFASLALPCSHAQCRRFTLDELSQYDGKDGRDLCVGVNGKVLKWVGDVNDPEVSMNYRYIADRYGGTDLTFKFSRLLYEPRYPIASCKHTMDAEHKRWVENLMVERMVFTNKPMYECIGLLEETPCELQHDHSEDNAENGNGSNTATYTTTSSMHLKKGDLVVLQRSRSSPRVKAIS
jgi:predicted heme/steroid binding protein